MAEQQFSPQDNKAQYFWRLYVKMNVFCALIGFCTLILLKREKKSLKYSFWHPHFATFITILMNFILFCCLFLRLQIFLGKSLKVTCDRYLTCMTCRCEFRTLVGQSKNYGYIFIPYVIGLSVSCRRWAVSSGYSGFLRQ